MTVFLLLRQTKCLRQTSADSQYLSLGDVQLLRDTTDEAQTSVTAAQLTEMTLFNRGNCGLKDSQPPTGGVGPVGALLGA